MEEEKNAQEINKVNYPQESGIIKNFFKVFMVMHEDEKKRISRDLHDEAGQMSVALGAGLNMIEKEIKKGNKDKALKLIENNKEVLKDIADRMKSIVTNLRPPALDLLGLPAALRGYFSQYSKACNIKIEFSENLKDKKLDENMGITLYRIVQESLTNILKHSGAQNAKVDLIFSKKEVRLIIEDNGCGFDKNELPYNYQKGKLGIYGMSERVNVLNGVLLVDSNIGKGTKIKVTLPLKETINGN